MFFVHRSCRNVAGVARTVGAAIGSKDERDRSFQHKQPRIKLVRVGSTMLVRFDFALTKLIYLAPKIGFKLGSIHRQFAFLKVWDNSAPRWTMSPFSDKAADSGDVARSFRDHVARCSDMMSPA